MKKNNFYKLNSTSGGALLFAIVTAFLLSFIAAGLVMLMTSQYKMIDNEVKRKMAYYKIRAGVEYANYCLYNRTVTVPPGESVPLVCPEYPDLSISIQNDPTGRSRYSILVTTNY